MTMRIGYVDRSFPDSWRPGLEEIVFAHTNGFQALQYMVHPFVSARADKPDVPFETLRDALLATAITPTLEVNCRVTDRGLLPDGRPPLALLEHYTPFITTMGCSHVHLHATVAGPFDPLTLASVEEYLISQFAEGVAWADALGITFGFEHNAPGEKNGQLFANPTRCAEALAALPDLGFVWDFNHTHPNDVKGFLALVPRVTLAHVSDTPLPAVNHHLPLGLGTVPLSDYCRALRDAQFQGVMILEIGGLPISGGYGKDTDVALITSRQLIVNS